MKNFLLIGIFMLFSAGSFAITAVDDVGVFMEKSFVSADLGFSVVVVSEMEVLHLNALVVGFSFIEAPSEVGVVDNANIYDVLLLDSRDTPKIRNGL
jgi:hypothetical protein